jgi:hypothetical protein
MMINKIKYQFQYLQHPVLRDKMNFIFRLETKNFLIVKYFK